MTKTEKKLLKIAAIALEIAAFPSPAADRAMGARRTIPKRLIKDLRTSLEDYGVDWRAYREANPGGKPQ